MPKPLRAVLIGCGNRGGMFGHLCRENPDLVQLVAVVEPRPDWRDKEGIAAGLPETARFADTDQVFTVGAPVVDTAIIASNDRSHYDNVIAALNAGCNVLLEKPVAHDPVLTRHMALLADQKGRQIAVQHELRYTPFFQKVREILQSGRIGQVISYTHTEHVEFWHMTHSFVRGNWGNADIENPMILAKCCHDLDLIPWLIDDTVTKVSSFGRLDHFTPANKPSGAPARCTDGCPVGETCIHNAETFYLGPRTSWPVAMLGPERDTSYEGRRKRLISGPYGRCVYGGYNNVVDHQTVMMETARGTICTLTMEGFSAGEECGRKIRFDGTKGTLRGNMGRGQIQIYNHWRGPFGTKSVPEEIDLSKAVPDGHGGGDAILFAHVMRAFQGGGESPLTPIAESVESHLLAWAAEESRHQNRVVMMDEFRNRIRHHAEALMQV